MSETPDQDSPVQLKDGSEKRRRSDRILAPVPIRVIANDASGVAFSEDAVTITFNQQGARISLTHSLLVDDVILIRNKQTAIEEEFRVVGAFQQVSGERREWGVEILDPEINIWGIDFSIPAEDMQPNALIECGACKQAVQSPLSSIEYDVLLAIGMISRHCERCKETTRWKPSQQTGLPAIIYTPKDLAAQKVPRKAKRIGLVMRVRVRNAWGIIDVAQTRDVSKLGLCFLSNKVFSVRDEVSIVLPFSAGSVPVETKGIIVWSAPTTGGRYYGVQYTK